MEPILNTISSSASRLGLTRCSGGSSDWKARVSRAVRCSVCRCQAMRVGSMARQAAMMAGVRGFSWRDSGHQGPSSPSMACRRGVWVKPARSCSTRSIWRWKRSCIMAVNTSSLLWKWKYTPPLVSPAAWARLLMVARLYPSFANTRSAAARICLRRTASGSLVKVDMGGAGLLRVGQVQLIPTGRNRNGRANPPTFSESASSREALRGAAQVSRRPITVTPSGLAGSTVLREQRLSPMPTCSASALQACH